VAGELEGVALLFGHRRRTQHRLLGRSGTVLEEVAEAEELEGVGLAPPVAALPRQRDGLGHRGAAHRRVEQERDRPVRVAAPGRGPHVTRRGRLGQARSAAAVAPGKSPP